MKTLKTICVITSLLVAQPLMAAPNTPAEPAEFDQVPTKMDRLKELQDQFDQSLQEFDVMLIEDRELLDPDDIDSLSSEASTAQESAAMSKAEQQNQGESEDSDQAGASGESQQAAGGPENSVAGGQAQQQGDGHSGTENNPATASSGASGNGAAKQGSGVKTPIKNSQGDDIVAKQLREAAEQETDPELKAKLWEEYYRYKKGAQ